MAFPGASVAVTSSPYVSPAPSPYDRGTQRIHHHSSSSDSPERNFSPYLKTIPYDDADTYSFDPSARLSMLAKRRSSITPEQSNRGDQQMMMGSANYQPPSPKHPMRRSVTHLAETHPIRLPVIGSEDRRGSQKHNDSILDGRRQHRNDPSQDETPRSIAPRREMRISKLAGNRSLARNKQRSSSESLEIHRAGRNNVCLSVLRD